MGILVKVQEIRREVRGLKGDLRGVRPLRGGGGGVGARDLAELMKMTKRIDKAVKPTISEDRSL